MTATIASRSTAALIAPLRLLNPGTARSTARGVARLPLAVALVGACALMWYVFAWRGLCYPLAVSDPTNAWGGPTLAGAWAVHFGLTAAILGALHGAAYGLTGGRGRP